MMLQLVVNILIVICSVLSLVGLVFLSQLSFSGEKMNDDTLIIKNVTNTKLFFSKFTIVLIWLQIFFSFLAVMISFSK
jgi:hypothetical protein